jgi:hypothetical protein
VGGRRRCRAGYCGSFCCHPACALRQKRKGLFKSAGLRHGRQGGAERPLDRERSVHAIAQARAARATAPRRMGLSAPLATRSRPPPTAVYFTPSTPPKTRVAVRDEFAVRVHAGGARVPPSRLVLRRRPSARRIVPLTAKLPDACLRPDCRMSCGVRDPDVLAEIRQCCGRWGLPRPLAWYRGARICGHGGRPNDEFAADRGQVRVWPAVARTSRPSSQGRDRPPTGLSSNAPSKPPERWQTSLGFQLGLDAMTLGRYLGRSLRHRDRDFTTSLATRSLPRQRQLRAG